MCWKTTGMISLSSFLLHLIVKLCAGKLALHMFILLNIGQFHIISQNLCTKPVNKRNYNQQKMKKDVCQNLQFKQIKLPKKWSCNHHSSFLRQLFQVGANSGDRQLPNIKWFNGFRIKIKSLKAQEQLHKIKTNSYEYKLLYCTVPMVLL